MVDPCAPPALEVARCQFAEFLGSTDLPPLTQFVRKLDRLSRALVGYVQYLYDMGAPQQRATPPQPHRSPPL